MSSAPFEFQIEVPGIAASQGVAIGRAFVLDRARLVGSQYHIPGEELKRELRRFQRALSQSNSQLQKLLARLHARGAGTEHTFILEAHLLMLQDIELVEGVRRRILETHINAEWALREFIKELKERFSRIDNEYFQERGNDIDQVGQRILKNLLGHQEMSVRSVPQRSILISHDLSPADTVHMLRGHVTGFVTELGGRTSHIVILARSMEVPALVGAEGVVQNVCTGDTVILDGDDGKLIIRPSESVLETYRLKRRRDLRHLRHLAENRTLPATTKDGIPVSLRANIEKLDELPALMQYGASGVGLYRTEFLFLNRHQLPDEEEQLQAYRAVLLAAQPHPVTIRLLDVGSDKGLLGEQQSEKDRHMSPALGLRGVRYVLQHPELLRPQLRALLRASAFGQVKIMVPMISMLSEIRAIRTVLEAMRAELLGEGFVLPGHVPLGIMVETPAAAVAADTLAPEVDFFSIGTNDLIHHTIAIDRMDERLAPLYQPTHPAVLRLLRNVLEAGARVGIEVSMCGEMAGEPLYAPLLVGLGLKHFSMTPMLIPAVKDVMRKVTEGEAWALAERALSLQDGEAIQDFLLERQRAFRR